MRVKLGLAGVLAGAAIAVSPIEAVAKVEFCGNTAVADIVVYNPNWRQLAAWCDGNPSQTLMLGTTSQGWSPFGVGNFNGGTWSDILLYGPTWEISYWPGGNPAASVITGQVNIGAGYQLLQSFGDFNGDGKDDLILWNESSGTVAVWYSADMSTSTILGTCAPGWYPMFVADVNGDGLADLVLYEDDSIGETGRFSYWLAGNPANSAMIAAPGAPWSLLGTGNLVAGPPACDLLWRNTDTGEIATSVGCNSGTLTSFTTIGSLGYPERVLQLEDHNGDGVTDIAINHFGKRGWKVSYFPGGVGAPGGYTLLGNINREAVWQPEWPYQLNIW